MTWRTPWRAGWWSAAVTGLALVVATGLLPWREPEFSLGLGVRLVMAVTGVAMLVAVGLTPRPARREGGVVVAAGALGASLLAYPSVLALGAADLAAPAGPVLGTLSDAFHALPLALAQLVPVLAASHAAGRAHRRWERAVVVVAVAGLVATGLEVLGVLGPVLTPVLLAAGTALWFGSFALAPVGAWVALRGSSGEGRRRAVVAGVASLVPFVVIVWCLAVVPLAAGVGVAEGDTVTTLMVALATGCALTGALGLASVGAGSRAVGPRAVTLTLDALVTALVLIAGASAALAATAATVPAGWALLAGAGAALAVALPWLRLHAWVMRAVDPAAELRHALRTLPSAPEGERRAEVLHVLRRIASDPELNVEYGVPAGSSSGGVVLARGDDGPAVVVHPRSPGAAQRLARLGDCTALLAPAVDEARLARATLAADEAAALATEAERQRLAQDLHDGLQGRLLGLALQLQLSGRDLGDPTARLLVDDSVAVLRSLVDDVRALGGGRVPAALASGGLAEALPVLLAPVAARSGLVVDLELPDADGAPGRRFAPPAEAAAYFVVGEAVSNALKHAAAGRVSVSVSAQDDGARLAVVVSDDGRGGADPRLGTGLRGLAERVSGAGGVLLVRERPGGGTVVEAVLPCGS